MPLFPQQRKKFVPPQKETRSKFAEEAAAITKLFPQQVIGFFPLLGWLTTPLQLIELRNVARRLFKAEKGYNSFALGAVGRAVKAGSIRFMQTPAARVSTAYERIAFQNSIRATASLLRRPIVPSIPAGVRISRQVAEKLHHRRPFAFAFARH